MTGYNYEDNQNKAFSMLLTNAAENMKDKGASDYEVKSLIDDAILGIINIIQDQKHFSTHVYSIIEETSKKKIIQHERQVGMMCELLDRIEDSLRYKIYDLLKYDNIPNHSHAILNGDFNTQVDDVLDILKRMNFDVSTKHKH